MTREIESIESKILEPEIYVFFAVELMFDTTTTFYNGSELPVEPLYFWTGLGNLTVGDKTYTGTGNMLSISEVKETADISAAGATLSLTGIPTDILALALQVPYQGRLCYIKFGLLDASKNLQRLLLENGSYLLLEDGNAVDANASMTTLFVGYMDQININEQADTSTVTLAVESKLIGLERPRIRRYTSASQKSRYPDDLAFNFIPDLQDRPLAWGRS